MSSSMTGFYLFMTLPEEMSLHIISFLSAEDMCALARTSRDLKRFSTENMLWRKLCKRNGWTVTRSVVHETPRPFDYKKYFSEKTLITRPGSLRWADQNKTAGTSPSKRFKHTATVVGQIIIFIGGQETDTKRFNEIVYYDTETKSFSQPTIKGDKVPAFSRHTSCLVGSKVYVFGGFDGHGTNFDLATFDPYNRTWANVSKAAQRGTPPPSRTNHAAASVGKNMYIFGGNNNNEEGKYQVLDDLNMLDTQTMTWSRPKTTGTAPCARSGHTLTAIGKKLYLFGGGVWNEREGWVHKFNDLYPCSLSSLSGEGVHFAIALASLLLCFLFSLLLFICSSTLKRYILDTETLHWTKPTSQGKIDTSTFPISFAVGRFLFIFGGGSKPHHSVTNDLYILDTATLAWSSPDTEGTKPQPRDMGTASTVGDSVYFLGGYAGGAVDFFDKMGVSCGGVITTGSACN